MKDYMYLAMATDEGVRGYAASTTHLVEEARLRHNTAPTATVALGRALTAAALMGGLLKVGQRVALKWEGDGLLRRIVVEADSNGSLRGYVAAPEVDLPLVAGEPDIVGAIGQAGLLTGVPIWGCRSWPRARCRWPPVTSAATWPTSWSSRTRWPRPSKSA